MSPKSIFQTEIKILPYLVKWKKTALVNIIYGWPQGNLWHESIKVLLTSFMYIPKVIFSNKNTNICLFGTVKETALTVIVDIINGWPLGHLWHQLSKYVKILFIDGPYDDLRKQKYKGVKI